MFWRKKTKPSLWQRFKMLWFSIIALLATIPTVTSTYYYLQPNFEHFEEHFKAEAVYFNDSGSLLIVNKVSNLPDVDTTIQVIIDNNHIHHLHFPTGIPDELGKQYKIGREDFLIPTRLNFVPEKPDVTIRFVFRGKFSITPTIFSTTTRFLDGNTKTEDKKHLKGWKKWTGQ